VAKRWMPGRSGPRSCLARALIIADPGIATRGQYMTKPFLDDDLQPDVRICSETTHDRWQHQTRNVPGTLSLSVPIGRSRKAFTMSIAASTSSSAGLSRSRRRHPPRWSIATRGTIKEAHAELRLQPPHGPLRLEAETPPSARITKFRRGVLPLQSGEIVFSASASIVHILAQPVPIMRIIGRCAVSICRLFQLRRFFYDDITAPAHSRSQSNREKHGLWCNAARRVRVFGPPKDRDARSSSRARAVASESITSIQRLLCPHITNGLSARRPPIIRTTGDVTKVGAVRGDDASWIPASRHRSHPRRPRQPSNLGVDVWTSSTFGS